MYVHSRIKSKNANPVSSITVGSPYFYHQEFHFVHLADLFQITYFSPQVHLYLIVYCIYFIYQLHLNSSPIVSSSCNLEAFLSDKNLFFSIFIYLPYHIICMFHLHSTSLQYSSLMPHCPIWNHHQLAFHTFGRSVSAPKSVLMKHQFF